MYISVEFRQSEHIMKCSSDEVVEVNAYHFR